MKIQLKKSKSKGAFTKNKLNSFNGNAAEKIKSKSIYPPPPTLP